MLFGEWEGLTINILIQLNYKKTWGKYGGGCITGAEKFYEYLDGYKYITPAQINVSEIDYVIVATMNKQYFQEIVEEAKQLGFDREQILPIKIFAIPGFDFDRYVELLHSHISIFANTCWGGVIYNALGMEFRSPFINMFEPIEDYLKILSAPQYYFNEKLKFDSWGNNLKWAYPICKLDDVYLHFNHSKSMDEVEAKWYDRVERINYDNLFVMMCTESEEMLERFANLPYTKKVCFVPFESSYSCACTLKFLEQRPNVPFWYFVNSVPSGEFNDYNLITLLSNGIVDHSRVVKREDLEL